MLDFLKEFWYTLTIFYGLSIAVIFCGRVIYQFFFFGLLYDMDFWNWTGLSFIIFTVIYLITLILYSYFRDKHFRVSANPVS